MIEARTLDTPLPDVTMAGQRWYGDPNHAVVLLHAGVCDSRSWERVAPELTDLATVWAYDRPGFGATPPSEGTRDHVADAEAFLDANVTGPAWLVGSSLGGAVALDLAVARPERVAGLVLLAPGITGGPEPTLSAQGKRLSELIDAATSAGDLDEANRYEVWFWLDGPDQPEGRVGGAARALALEMNRTILGYGREGEFDESIDAWRRLGELKLPVTVAVGEYDATFIADHARQLAASVPGATYLDLAGSPTSLTWTYPSR